MAYRYVPPCMQTLLIIISAVALLASMLSSVAIAVAAEPPSGGYRFELTHVDAHGNFTKQQDELIRRIATSTPPSFGETTSKLSKVRYSEREYLMEIIDSHYLKYEAIADTGSSLIWLKPKSDRRCQPLRDNKLCQPPLCKCMRGGVGCKYKTEYGDGVVSSGLMCLETLRFHHSEHHQPNGHDNYVSVENIAIGWSNSKGKTKCAKTHPNCIDLKKYDGTVGLGRGDNSLVRQLNAHTFSYCLATHDNAHQKSKIFFDGSPPALESSTPLLAPHLEGYYVRLERIKIGDTQIELSKPEEEEEEEQEEESNNNPKPDEEEENAAATRSLETPKHNMFIDSGTTYTILERTAYQALVDHLNKAMPAEKATRVDYESTVCWTGIAKDDDIKVLQELKLELHFAGGLVMYLDKNQIIYDDLYDEHGHRRPHKQVCLAIRQLGPEKNPRVSVSVLGNFQQQNQHMHFDIHHNKLSFVKVDDCTKVE